MPSQCWCGRNPNITLNGRKVSPIECSATCAGSPTGETCGGHERISIYSIAATADDTSTSGVDPDLWLGYLGCYDNGGPGRVMVNKELASAEMTNQVRCTTPFPSVLVRHRQISSPRHVPNGLAKGSYNHRSPRCAPREETRIKEAFGRVVEYFKQLASHQARSGEHFVCRPVGVIGPLSSVAVSPRVLGGTLITMENGYFRATYDLSASGLSLARGMSTVTHQDTTVGMFLTHYRMISSIRRTPGGKVKL